RAEGRVCRGLDDELTTRGGRLDGSEVLRPVRVEGCLVHHHQLERVGDTSRRRGGEGQDTPPTLERGIVSPERAAYADELREQVPDLLDALNLLTRLLLALA